MTRTSVCLCLLALLASVGVAQDAPEGPTVTLTGYGEPLDSLAASMAKQLGYQFIEPGDEMDGLQQSPTWVSIQKRPPQQAAAMLALASGCPVHLDAVRKQISLSWAGDEPHARVKGYDVSVIASAYARYINTYARKRSAEDKAVGLAAADHLAELVEAVTWLKVRVVGDRLVLRATDAGHARVAELLELLRADAGGESVELSGERALFARLAGKRVSVSAEETPLFSVAAAICSDAKVDYAVMPNAQSLGQEHVDFTATDEPALDALRRLLGSYSLHLGCGHGALTINSEVPYGSGLRVFELGALLKKLAESYARQQTQPNEGGFTGDIRDMGGIDVVTTALFELMLEEERSAEVRSFGTRLIIRGTLADCDFAEAALKEMGWMP